MRGRKFDCDSIPCVTTGIIILYYKQFYHFIFLYTYINYEINKNLILGEQVLDSYGFNEPSTTGFAIFGLSMLLLGFLTVSYVALFINKISYIPLGHVGKLYAKHKKVNI